MAQGNTFNAAIQQQVFRVSWTTVAGLANIKLRAGLFIGPLPTTATGALGCVERTVDLFE
jgi:hypothetical protein